MDKMLKIMQSPEQDCMQGKLFNPSLPHLQNVGNNTVSLLGVIETGSEGSEVPSMMSDSHGRHSFNSRNSRCSTLSPTYIIL